MARAVISDRARRTTRAPLYDLDRETGASVEVFYADRVLAHSFGARGPAGSGGHINAVACRMMSRLVLTDYLAYRDFAMHCTKRRCD
jgi:hypothetical protein